MRSDVRPVGRTEPRLGLAGDVVDELRWTATGRKGWLLGLAFNVAVAAVYVAYTHYDPHKPDDIRIANVGAAIVVWTLSNVINTNQLGADNERAALSLERGDKVVRILAIKNLALAILLAPIALAVSVLVRVPTGSWRLLPHALMVDVAAVFLWLGIGSVVSVLLPYRPIALRERLRARRTWPRWAFCLALPDIAYFVLVPLLHVPYITLYQLKVFGPYQPNFLAYSTLYLAIGLAYWGLGLLLALLYGYLRPSQLVASLARAD